MRKFLDRLYLGCGIISAASLVGIVILVAGQIVARFFYTNIPSSDDISGYMVAWTTFMGLAYAMNKGDHIRVDLFVNKFSRQGRRRLATLVSLIGFALIFVFFFYTFSLVKEAYIFDDKTSGQLPLSLWMVQMPFVVGIFVLLISVLDLFLSQILNKKNT